MSKKLIKRLTLKGGVDQLKNLENQKLDFEIDCAFEGEATILSVGKIVKNEIGEYFLEEEDGHHLFNFTKYLTGKFKNKVYRVRVYEYINRP